MNISWLNRFSKVTNIFFGVSVLALFVLNLERYLATHHPIFHRNSVTKRKLLSSFGLLTFILIILVLMHVIFGISVVVIMLIFLAIFTPPLLYINYKLFKIANKSRVSPEMKTRFSIKNIASCLLVSACYAVLLIPPFITVALNKNSKQHHADFVSILAQTVGSMNSTLNCVVFYWKSNILRAEGIKFIKKMKTCGRG